MMDTKKDRMEETRIVSSTRSDFTNSKRQSPEREKESWKTAQKLATFTLWRKRVHGLTELKEENSEY
jgi:hypothetical protein